MSFYLYLVENTLYEIFVRLCDEFSNLYLPNHTSKTRLFKIKIVFIKGGFSGLAVCAVSMKDFRFYQ